MKFKEWSDVILKLLGYNRLRLQSPDRLLVVEAENS